jgi:pimeloyl-ACP methyl ester carboxylesterase
MTRYAYLHGFASSSKSYKGTTLARRLGPDIELERPDLNVPSFERLTVTGALEELDRLHEEAPDEWCIIGSSMGGYIAARWCELHPERIHRLVLLCPGFDLASRWPSMLGEAVWKKWREDGVITLPGPDGAPRELHWGFIEDFRHHPPYPEVSCPTAIVHGLRDDVVPIDTSREYADQRDNVSLIEVDDDHGLASSVDRIEAVVREHFEL